MYGTFELGKFNQTDPKLNKSVVITSYVDVDTGDRGRKLEFEVPIKASYLCADTGDFHLTSHLHYTFSDAPSQGTLLSNATVDAKKVQLDAFRTEDAPKGRFQVITVKAPSVLCDLI